jgi:hypothetical protein
MCCEASVAIHFPWRLVLHISLPFSFSLILLYHNCVFYLIFFLIYCLSDILSSEFEESRFSAVEALKGLIDNCIDETLVSQGIAQIKARHQGSKSDPTIIE